MSLYLQPNSRSRRADTFHRIKYSIGFCRFRNGNVQYRNDKTKKVRVWDVERLATAATITATVAEVECCVSSAWKLQMLVFIGFMDKINIGIVGLVSFTSLYLCLSIISLESHENVNFPFFIQTLTHRHAHTHTRHTHRYTLYENGIIYLIIKQMWLFNKVLGCRIFEKCVWERDRTESLKGDEEAAAERMIFFWPEYFEPHLFIPEENFPHIEHDVQLYLSRYCLLFILTLTLSSPSRFTSIPPCFRFALIRWEHKFFSLFIACEIHSQAIEKLSIFFIWYVIWDVYVTVGYFYYVIVGSYVKTKRIKTWTFKF